MGLKPVKNLYPLKTINKNIKNRAESESVDENDESGVQLLKEFLNKIGRKDLNGNSEGVKVYDINDGRRKEPGKDNSVPDHNT